jgi:hypothetical protein
MTMIDRLRHQVLPVALAGSLMALLPGCDTGHARLTPRGEDARVAVETALSAWRDGRAYDKIEAPPPVRVVDSAWRDGQKIDKFEILREENGDGGTKVFTVRLSTKKPPAEHETVYIVYGQDPTWVYREDDYNRMLQMDNNPTTSKSKSRPSRRGR